MTTQATYAQYGQTHELLPAPFANAVFKRNSTNDGWDSVTIAALLSAASGTVTFSGVTFQGFNPPSAPSSPATKEYVDGLIQGLSFKSAVVAATISALPSSTYSNGTSGVGATLTATANGAFPAVDGITLILNDSVLVKDEVTAANNGIYTLTQIGNGSSPWVLTRRDDANASTELAGAFVYVETGTSNGGGSYALPLRASSITVGTTALSWSLFSSATVLAVASPYLSRSGNTLSATVSASGSDFQTVGSANAPGSSGKLADAAHVHAHGNQAGGSLHAVANSTTAGFMTAAQVNQLSNLPTTVTDTQDTSSNALTNVGTASYTVPAGRVTLLAVVTAKEKTTNAWGASFLFVAHYKSDGSTATVQGENDPAYLITYDGGQGVVAKFNVVGNVVNVAVVSNSDQVHWAATLYAFPA